MKKSFNPSRLLALATAGVLSAGIMLHPAPARADKAKTYKYGAVALGALGAYLLSKGKTVEGAAVLGAGAYTYKKGEDTRKADKNDNYRDRYGYRDRDRNRNDDRYRSDDRYRDDDRYGNRNSYDYRVPPSNRLNDRGNSGSRAYRNDERYNDRDRDNNRYAEREKRNPKIRVR